MFRNKPVKFVTWIIIGIAGLVLAMIDPFARYQVQNSRLICLAVGLGTALIVAIAFLLWWLRYRRVSLTDHQQADNLAIWATVALRQRRAACRR